jgi:hypothetical protein
MTGVALQQRDKRKMGALVEEPASEGLDVVSVVTVRELDVEQKVGNTCAPRALLTGLESIYSKAELQATSYGDIDETTEGVGGAWIQPHLDACDREGRITVIDSICMISDAQHHELKLKSLVIMFVPTKTTFGLIVSTATAQELDACLGRGLVQAPLNGSFAPRCKWWHWIYLEVNFEDDSSGAPLVYYADSQSEIWSRAKYAMRSRAKYAMMP